jgi:hypothetical protein
MDQAVTNLSNDRIRNSVARRAQNFKKLQEEQVIRPLQVGFSDKCGVPMMLLWLIGRNDSYLVMVAGEKDTEYLKGVSMEILEGSYFSSIEPIRLYCAASDFMWGKLMADMTKGRISPEGANG